MATPSTSKRQQMNVRLPPDLIDTIDARRAPKGMSRDRWVENALRFAIREHPTPTVRAENTSTT